MAKRDLYNNVGVVAAIAPAVLTATATGTGVDLRGFNSATLVINAGAIVGAGLFVPKLQESDDNSTFTDVAATDLLGAFPASVVAAGAIKVGYKGYKRYLRAVLTYTSGTSLAVDATFVLGHANYNPVP